MTIKNTKNTKTVNKWAVFNKKTGKVAYTRESGYHRKAEFATRKAAREAVNAGRVMRNTDQAEIRKINFDGTNSVTP